MTLFSEVEAFQMGSYVPQVNSKVTSRAQANQNGENELSACILLKDFSDGDWLKPLYKTNTTSLTQNFFSLPACELQFSLW